MVPFHRHVWLWSASCPCTNDDPLDDSHQQDESCFTIDSSCRQADETLKAASLQACMAWCKSYARLLEADKYKLVGLLLLQHRANTCVYCYGACDQKDLD